MLACECCDCDVDPIEINDKVFSNANENGAANGILFKLNDTIAKINDSIENKVFTLLLEKFNVKTLPVGIGASVNEKRLCIANEAIIVNTLLTTLHKSYKTYIDYLNGDNKETFKGVFIKFLTIVEAMIMRTLANYIVKNYNTPINVNLNDDNPFKLCDDDDINVNLFLDIHDCVKLRNTVGQLFTLTFGKIAYNYLNSLNNGKKLSVNDILALDCITINLPKND
jgi:hypothetical protein